MSNEPSQLNTDLAVLLGFAAGNRTAAANAIKQALQGLGIDKHTRSLTDTDKQAIIDWHKARLTNDKQTDFVELVESIAAPVINEPIETAPAVIEQVETIADDAAIIIESIDSNNTVIDDTTDYSNNTTHNDNDSYSNNTVIDDTRYSDNAVVKIAFRTNTYNENKRQCVTLEGDTVNLLMLATGINKRDVPKWVQNAVNEWTAFDDKLPITRQVRRLIMRELESQLIKARG